MRRAGAHRKSMALRRTVIAVLASLAGIVVAINPANATTEPDTDDPTTDVVEVRAPAPDFTKDGVTLPGAVEGLQYEIYENVDRCDQLTRFVRLVVADGYKVIDPPVKLPPFEEFTDFKGEIGWVGPTKACPPAVPVTEEPKPQALPSVGAKEDALAGMLYGGIVLLAGAAIVAGTRRQPRHRRP